MIETGKGSMLRVAVLVVGGMILGAAVGAVLVVMLIEAIS